MRFVVENGSFAYGKNTIFENVNFSLDDHEILAVLGPNAAGKTTLLKCVMNMLSWKTGCACLDGTNIRSIPIRQFWQTVSWVPQTKLAATSYTVKDMILLGRNPYLPPFSNPGPEDDAVVERIMGELGITGLARQNCNKISGGEFQLVMIGRALATEPHIIIMDEPESGLDFRNQLMILEIIKQLSRNASCIFNTHYPDHAQRIADKVLLLGGKVSGDEKSFNLYGEADKTLTRANLSLVFGVDVIMGRTKEGDYPYIVPAL
jgi:iron complex transport system ATP-binding protein